MRWTGEGGDTGTLLPGQSPCGDRNGGVWHGPRCAWGWWGGAPHPAQVAGGVCPAGKLLSRPLQSVSRNMQCIQSIIEAPRHTKGPGSMGHRSSVQGVSEVPVFGKNCSDCIDHLQGFDGTHTGGKLERAASSHADVRYCRRCQHEYDSSLVPC